MCNHLLNPRKYWVLERDRRPQFTQNVTLVNDVEDPRICKLLKRWRPRRDLNPCYRRESLLANRNFMTLLAQEPFGKASRRGHEHVNGYPKGTRRGKHSIAIRMRICGIIYIHCITRAAPTNIRRTHSFPLNLQATLPPSNLITHPTRDGTFS